MKKELISEIKEISKTIDIEAVNNSLKATNGMKNFTVSTQMLINIGKWALDRKSFTEIRNNLELTEQQWLYLITICPAVLMIMEHSVAYADIVVGSTLLQTAIGGHTIKKKMPMKKRIYEDGRVVGEVIELVEYEDIAPSNPYLLKYLAEHKLSENFGKAKGDTSKEHREIINGLTDDELKAISEVENGK